MNTSIKIIGRAFVVSLILLSGCAPGQLLGPTFTPTPAYLTDEEFTEVAQAVCGNLKTEIANLDPFMLFDLEPKANAYRKATDALIDLEITEQSAPNGFHLRSGLIELADLSDVLGKQISEAINQAGLDGPITIMITDNGGVFAHTGSIFDTTRLDVDATLIEKLQSVIEQTDEAAITLGLEDCVIGVEP